MQHVATTKNSVFKLCILSSYLLIWQEYTAAAIVWTTSSVVFIVGYPEHLQSQATEYAGSSPAIHMEGSNC